ncbi:hypothetical protein ACHAWF_012282 [Thalassiosira exigua]
MSLLAVAVASCAPSARPARLGSRSALAPPRWLALGRLLDRGRATRCLHSERDRNSRSGARLPPRMTIARAARLFRARKLTSEQLCRHSRNLALFGEKSLLLNAYTKVLSWDQILQQARRSDERMRRGSPKSLIDGVPVTIKGNIAVGGYWEMPNAGSFILTRDEETSLRESAPDDTSIDDVYESDIARRLLKDCGAVIIGITNMDEFGMGSLGTNNGLDCQDSHQQSHREKRYSPTYNPLPWMQRISPLLQGNFDGDEYWLKQIEDSTPENPHGIDDKDALDDLLNDVKHWVCGNITERNSNCKDDSTSPLLSPGGSSSGAGAATAHGSALLSVGTDTGGSLRLPSAWTSTVGFKPTYGTWSRYGVVSYASSLDTVGYITGTTECAEIAWRCLRNKNDSSGNRAGRWNGQMCRDPTSTVYHNAINAGTEGEHSTATTAKPLADVRVGIPSAFSLQELPPVIAEAWSESARHLQNAGGATLVPISESKVPSEWIKLALAAYYVLACAEASSNLSRYDGVRYGREISELDVINDEALRPLHDMNTFEEQVSATRVYGFGEEVQRRVLAGTSVLSSDRFHTHYEAAAVVRAKLSQSLERVFRMSPNDGATDSDKVDVMLVPTALSFPCTLNPGSGSGFEEQVDPTAAFANDVMTTPISLGGFPSISVPVELEYSNSDRVDNVIGMQIFSTRGFEDLVLRVARAMR